MTGWKYGKKIARAGGYLVIVVMAAITGRDVFLDILAFGLIFEVLQATSELMTSRRPEYKGTEPEIYARRGNGRTPHGGR